MIDFSSCWDAYDNVRSLFASVPKLKAGTKRLLNTDTWGRDTMMILSPIPGCKGIMSGHVVSLGASGSDRRGNSAEKLAPKSEQLPALRERAVSALKKKGIKHATASSYRSHTVDEFVAVSNGVACIITVRADRSYKHDGYTFPAYVGVYVEFMSARNRDVRELLAIKQTRPIDLTI